MPNFKSIIALAAAITAISTLGASAAVLTHVAKTPNYPTASNAEKCTDLMGYMRSVRADEIAAISNQRIVLMPVCEESTVMRRDNYGSLFIDGNAEKLRMPIARNADLMSALASKNYDQNDVVSIRFGGNDSVILYVHQRSTR